MTDGLKKKIEVSIERLKAFEPAEGYYLAFSGGKDSCVIKALADMAGVKYDAHYRVVTVDPPELVKFIKDVHPDVYRDIPRYKDGTPKTMWNLIVKNSMFPTRIIRYCCKELKEDGGDGRVTVTGVRWEESVRRKRNQGIAIIRNADITKDFENSEDFKKPQDHSNGVILVNDNEESRKMVERCFQRGKVTINPIIDWTTAEVWEFIRGYKIPYCKLYDEGWERLGCIGCPMATTKERQRQFARYPKYKTAYMNAFEKMQNKRIYEGKPLTYKGYANNKPLLPNDIFHWWMQDGVISGQTSIFDEEGE